MKAFTNDFSVKINNSYFLTCGKLSSFWICY